MQRGDAYVPDLNVVGVIFSDPHKNTGFRENTLTQPFRFPDVRWFKTLQRENSGDTAQVAETVLPVVKIVGHGRRRKCPRGRICPTLTVPSGSGHKMRGVEPLLGIVVPIRRVASLRRSAGASNC